MPTSEEPKHEESTKDQPAVPDLEITTEELELEDSGTLPPVVGMGEPMVLCNSAPKCDLVNSPLRRLPERAIP